MERPYELRGKTKPFADSLETVFDIEFEDLDLPFYLAYVPFKMNFRVPSAFLDAKAKITFLRSKDKAPVRHHRRGPGSQKVSHR